MTTVTFGELSFELRHSAKRRTVGITVERDGSLILDTPPEISTDALAKVVQAKRFWIYSKILKKKAMTAPLHSREYVTGEGFYYLGRSYRLKLVDENSAQPALRLYQSRFEFQRSAKEFGKTYFIDWYRLHLLPILEQEINQLKNRVGAEPRSINIRELGYRWGSCGHKGDLNFHWRVALLPRSAISYIVSHELIHLVEPNHTKDFWERLERIIPDYSDRKEWLAKNGAAYDL